MWIPLIKKYSFIVCVLVAIMYACNKPSAVEFDSTFIKPHASKTLLDTSIYLDIVSQATENVLDTFSVASASHYVPIGVVSSLEFGKVEASSFIQYQPATFPSSLLGKNRLIDSTILMLKCTLFEGDTLAQNYIEIHEIQDNNFAENKKKKFNKNNITIKPNGLLGTYNKNFHQLRLDTGRDHVTVYKDVLRTKIDNDWGARFLQQDNTTGLKSDSLYDDFFNGIVLKPTLMTSNTMVYCSVRDTNSRMIVYYSYENTDGERKKTNFKLPFTSSSSFATEVQRDRSGSNVELALSATSHPSLFLQPPPNGTHFIVEPPSNLEFLSGIAINKAEIILEHNPVPLANGSYSIPLQLYIDVLKKDDTERRPMPVTLSPPSLSYTFFPSKINQSYLGGAYDKKTNKNFDGYRINVTRYVQGMILGNQSPQNFKIWTPYFLAYNLSDKEKASGLFSSNNYLAQSGVRVYGQDPTNPKSIRMRIVYTK